MVRLRYDTNTVEAEFTGGGLPPKPISFRPITYTGEGDKGEVREPRLMNHKAVFVFMDNMTFDHGPHFYLNALVLKSLEKAIPLPVW